MKIQIIFVLLLYSLSMSAQDYFKEGVKYYRQKNYVMADSMFTKQLNVNPSDQNVIFNSGIVKLNLKDTCAFCNDMYILYHTFQDKNAEKLYFLLCGRNDTMYFDKHYLPSDKHHFKYYEILEHHKYTNLLNGLYGEIHAPKSNHRLTIASTIYPLSKIPNDIIATFCLYGDSTREYLFTQSPPSFPGDEDAKLKYVLHSPYYIQAMKELKLHHVVVDVQYIIDKDGKIKDITVTEINGKTDNIEELKKLTKLIIANMPTQIPATFMGEKVDYLKSDFVSYW